MATFNTTVKHALRWLVGSNVVSDIDAGFQALAEDIDAKIAAYSQGLLSARPTSTAGTPGKTGRLYFATDDGPNGTLYFDYGTGWRAVPITWLRDSSTVVSTSDSIRLAARLAVGGAIDAGYQTRIYGALRADGAITAASGTLNLDGPTIAKGGGGELSYQAPGAFHIFRSNNSSGTADGDIYYQTAFPTSDARLKDAVATIEGALDKVRALRGVEFVWAETGQPAVGLIAQEVRDVIPAAVGTLNVDAAPPPDDGGPLLGVNYEGLVGLLAQAIGELAGQLDDERAAREALEARVTALEAA